MSWKPTKLSEFLTERDGRIKYESANQLGLQRIKKIDFSGNIHLDAETDTKTDMIRVKSGDLVISGINAAKGAIAVHAEDDDVLATIHYSAYEFNPDRISVDFLKWFFKSSEFSELLREQIPGGIKTELKPKHILPLQVKLPKLSEQIAIAERLNLFRFDQLRLEHEIEHQQSLVATLKQAILQEAIQGKLTTDWRAKNPGVEPASQLLQRIQAEKARLIAAKKLRKEKPLPKISSDEIPFAIPTGWEWCRLGAISRFFDYRGKTPNKISGGVRLITAKNVKFGRFSDTPRDYVSEESYRRHMVRGFPENGDILFTTEAPLGNACQLEMDEPYALGQRLITIQPIISNKRLFLFAMLSRAIQEQLIEKASGITAKGIKSSRLIQVLIPLPPLAEQAAIVERVEALMATCRALEAEIEHARAHAAHILQAVLKEAFAPAA